MNTIQTQKELIEWIATVQDETVLLNILQFKNAAQGRDWWDDLTEE